MRIRRHFTVEGHSPYEGIAFRTAASEIRIEKLAPFSIVGPGVEIPDGNPAPIFQLWQNFPPAEKPESFSGVWGVCWMTGEESFHYIAGFVVPHGTKAPEGQEARTFPGAKYAVFPFKGAVDDRFLFERSEVVVVAMNGSAELPEM